MNQTREQTRLGEIDQLSDGSWRLCFTRTLPHPRETVWQALTDPEHLTHWFPTTIEGERAAGAPLRFAFPEDMAPAMDGEMLVVEEPTVLELRWGPDVLRFELRAVAAGTELTLLDTLEAHGKAARDGAGWHVCLEGLEAHLRGDRGDHSSPDRWREVHPAYVQSFGPEAATIGPPQEFG
jgi:uncharacterized protein YndB with AHSA1/START domain